MKLTSDKLHKLEEDIKTSHAAIAALTMQVKSLQSSVEVKDKEIEEKTAKLKVLEEISEAQTKKLEDQTSTLKKAIVQLKRLDELNKGLTARNTDLEEIISLKEQAAKEAGVIFSGEVSPQSQRKRSNQATNLTQQKSGLAPPFADKKLSPGAVGGRKDSISAVGNKLWAGLAKKTRAMSIVPGTAASYSAAGFAARNSEIPSGDGSNLNKLK